MASSAESRLDEAFRKFKAATNMGCSGLKRWKKNPCSRAASLSRAPLNRNIRLACRKKSEWTSRDIRDALRTVSFVSRMKAVKSGEPVCGGLSKRSISLKNWAYDPHK